MLGFSYCKYAGPTDYVAIFQSGKLKKAGLGLTFLAGPRTTVAIVPINIQSVPFNVTEVTSDDQTVGVSGELVASFEPDEALKLYDFSVERETGAYRNDGIEAAHTLLRTLVPGAVR